MNNNLIVKGICLKVPVSRAWKALSDPQEFGAWFGVKVEGTFRPGHINVGHITHPGYEHLEWKVTTEAVEPERYLAFKWHPYAVDPNTDYSEETPTLVEFRIEPMGDGTLLTVVESGFENIPDHRRREAYRMNDGAWAAQMKNIEKHVAN